MKTSDDFFLHVPMPSSKRSPNDRRDALDALQDAIDKTAGDGASRRSHAAVRHAVGRAKKAHAESE